MSKYCFLHIGTHKTATTSIQRFLCRNAEYLAQQGLYVPKTGRVEEFSGHHNLAWELNNDPRFNKAFGSFEDLKKEILHTKPNNIVLSSEDFEYLHGQQNRKQFIYDFFSSLGFEIKIVVFVRNQIDYANSLFNTLILFHLYLGFEQYITDIQEKYYFEMHIGTSDNKICKWRYWFDYHHLLTDWSKPFTDNIICRSFDDERSYGKIEDRFIKCLGIEPTPEEKLKLCYQAAENQSLGQPATEAISLYNVLSKNLDIDPEIKTKGFNMLLRKYQNTSVKTKAFNGFDNYERELTARVFHEKNKLLEDDFGVKIVIPTNNETDKKKDHTKPMMRISNSAMDDVVSVLNQMFRQK